MKKYIWLLLFLLLMWPPYSQAKETTEQGTATLTWVSPTENVDGSPLTDLAGWKVYYGTSSGVYTEVLDIGSNPNSTFDLQLRQAIYYFTVAPYDTSGNEGDKSNEASKDITDVITIIPPKPATGLSCVQKIIN